MVDNLTDWLGFYCLDTSVGIGQVRMSTAVYLENNNYIPKTASNEGGWELPIIGKINGTETMARYKRLEDDSINTFYVAAYIRYFIDTWVDKYPLIEEKCDILCTLFNIGHEKTKPNSNPTPNEFGKFAQNNYDLMYILLYG